MAKWFCRRKNHSQILSCPHFCCCSCSCCYCVQDWWSSSPAAPPPPSRPPSCCPYAASPRSPWLFLHWTTQTSTASLTTFDSSGTCSPLFPPHLGFPFWRYPPWGRKRRRTPGSLCLKKKKKKMLKLLLPCCCCSTWRPVDGCRMNSRKRRSHLHHSVMTHSGLHRIDFVFCISGERRKIGRRVSLSPSLRAPFSGAAAAAPLLPPSPPPHHPHCCRRHCLSLLAHKDRKALFPPPRHPQPCKTIYFLEQAPPREGDNTLPATSAILSIYRNCQLLWLPCRCWSLIPHSPLPSFCSNQLLEKWDLVWKHLVQED